jgi:hypothetical protein
MGFSLLEDITLYFCWVCGLYEQFTVEGLLLLEKVRMCKISSYVEMLKC